jgi:trk system potassium uptake protein TrkA
LRIVIIGGGGVGRHLAASLGAEAEVVVLDPSPEALAEVEDGVDALTLRGDGTHRRSLRAAEVHRADLVVAVSGSDTVNVTAAALATTLGARRSVARVDDPGFYETDAAYERDVLGVYALLCASRLVSGELLRKLSGGDCRCTFSLAGGALHGAVVEVPDDSPAVGVAPSRLRAGGEDTVVAVLRGTRVRAAAEVMEVEAGDALLSLGAPTAVAHLVRHVRERDAGRAVLIGGGDIGGQLAASMTQFERDVRLIEHDRARCDELAALLPGVRVLHGDGTNLNLLRDERIGMAASLCAVTQSDEVNLMASLLGRELGVRRTLALVHRPGYAPVYDHLGIHGTTSAHEVLAHVLQWLLPDRRVVGRAGLHGTDHEVIEFLAPRVATVGMTARDLPLPTGTLVLGTVGQSGKIRRTDEELSGGEHILAIVSTHQLRDFERGLARLDKKGLSA